MSILFLPYLTFNSLGWSFVATASCKQSKSGFDMNLKEVHKKSTEKADIFKSIHFFKLKIDSHGASPWGDTGGRLWWRHCSMSRIEQFSISLSDLRIQGPQVTLRSLLVQYTFSHSALLENFINNSIDSSESKQVALSCFWIQHVIQNL